MSQRKGYRGLKFEFNAPVTLGFVGICLAAMVANILTGGAANHLLFTVYSASFLNPLTWFRLVGHSFGHMDWNHLINNMMMILLLGPMLEEKYGSGDLAIVILVTAVLEGLVYCLLLPGQALLGASGVVFAMILLSSITRTRDDAIPVTFLLVAILYIGREVWQGLTLNDNISHLGHIMGGAIGAALGFALKKARG